MFLKNKFNYWFLILVFFNLALFSQIFSQDLIPTKRNIVSINLNDDGSQLAFEELYTKYLAIPNFNLGTSIIVCKHNCGNRFNKNLSCPQVAKEGFIIKTVDLNKTTEEEKPQKAIFICSNDSLGMQYAIYEFLQILGFRFFHPEEEYIPKEIKLPAQNINILKEPKSFNLRGFHQHTMHPIEAFFYLLEPKEENLIYAYHYIDWLIKNKQNYFQWAMLNTVPFEQWKSYIKKIIGYAKKRSLKVGINLGLSLNQQNSFNLIENTKIPFEQQQKELKKNLDKILSLNFDVIDLNIGTSEFTQADDTQLVKLLNYAGYYLGLYYPRTKLFTNIHVTSDMISPTYKMNFFYLPAVCDASVGVFVHTTMFYDLWRSAPVYGNIDFASQRNFLLSQIGKRNVVYYPESAYWLGFDIDTPLFLPIYLETRSKDIESLRDKKILGHITFTSGSEWLYWLTDYGIAKLTYEDKSNWENVLKNYSSIYGKYSENVFTILKDITLTQVIFLLEKNLMGYIRGHDSLVDFGDNIGLKTQPKRILFSSILKMQPKKLQEFKEQVLLPLKNFADKNEEWANKINILTKLIIKENPNAKDFFKELKNAINVNYYRAKFIYLLYQSVYEYKMGNKDKVNELIKAAEIIITKTKKAIKNQQKLYRYPEKFNIIEGENYSWYKYSYLNKTASLYYFTTDLQNLKQVLKY